MGQLSASKRAQLPDSAFASIDSKGRRRLPIHDEAHVRNALARFNQTPFEDDAAREKARRRLLTAAKRYGIVPVGFMTGQLRYERQQGEIQARATDVRDLPTGAVIFLFTDIEGSTGLLDGLGDGYAAVLADLRRIQRRAVRAAGGHEVDARADEFFAVFDEAGAALRAALAVQRAIGEAAWPTGHLVRLRIGIHSGRPTLTDTGYVGLAVHAAARVCGAARGGQILLSEAVRRSLDGQQLTGVTFRAMRVRRLRGLREAMRLFAVSV
ncbi:MAG: adenylate/guanylate cyclase domain-containing protein [Candidatus Limnocylindria bacterium]